MIELLVVITIIGILAGLLFPVFGNIRRSAKRTTCLNNIRQLHLASVMYARDWNDWFPYRGTVSPHWFTTQQFTNMLKPYLEARDKSMFCPGDLYRARNPKTTSPDYVNVHVTYQYFNIKSPGSPGNPGGWLNPTPCPDLTRATTDNARFPLWGCLTVDKGSGLFLAHDVPEQRNHPTGMNVVRVDGSADWTIGTRLDRYYRGNEGTFYWPIP